MSERDGDGPGEVSLSIEETNKLRASLGLKPLQASGSKVAEEQRAGAERRKQESDVAAAQALAERIARSKERRKQQATLEATQKLSAPDEEVDDALAWIERSRRLTAQSKAPARASARAAEGDGEHTGADLAGFKIKHDFEDLEAGEEVVLTLEDRGILDDKGRLAPSDDEEGAALENVLLRETRDREKAYRDSGKAAKPLWEEDGQRRGLLDKYDEEEQEVLVLGRQGTIDPGAGTSRSQREAGVRAALQAGLEALEGPTPGSDFYTPEEMAQFAPKKKKKARKLKQRALTAEELDALAAETARGSNGGDLAAAEERAARGAAGAREAAAEADERRARSTAPWRGPTRPLRRCAPDAGGAGDDDEDPELAASLARARALALKAKEATGEKEEGGNGELEAGARSPSPDAPMTSEPEPEPEEEEGAADAAAASGWGIWAPAGEESAPAPAEKPKPKPRSLRRPRPAEAEPAGPSGAAEAPVSAGIAGDRAIGAGMAGALAFLQSRGELAQAVEWAGRTNDVKKAHGDGLNKVYTGGREADRVAMDVEVALTRKDEFGRLLTPKEAFRQQCHHFHGIFPSKNSVAKRQRQVEEEIKRKRVATGEQESTAMEQMRQVQKKQATPYVVLSGTVRPGQSRDAAAGLEPLGAGEIDAAVADVFWMGALGA
ncbi:hypothetical protein QBZ16_003431 [Prototheca wickerhamii]|uniref:SNU66-like protein n=1 Tax=Prototheca wickerhamii TaxID=3111 RepID=A0AAD9IHH5_PROWI|nr:hypothetical protein QBZ16_003431 [Prototheca wickerhamii]